LYALRSLYAASLLILLWTAWQAVIGFDRRPSLREEANLGSLALELFSLTQLALVLFVGSLYGAGTVSIEKDRRTFILLLVTRLSDAEIVLGKFAGACLQVGSVLLAGVPVFFALVGLGGVSVEQIGLVLAATVGGALTSMAFGVLMGVWRDKSYQAIALTLSAVAFFLIVVEVALATFGERVLAGEPIAFWGACFSPIRAIAHAVILEPNRPEIVWPAYVHLGFGVVAAGVLLVTATVGLRRWNPRGEPIQQADTPTQEGNVAGRRGRARDVWVNPVLWREIRTRAYGTRPILVKIAYLFVVGVLLANLVRQAGLTGGSSSTGLVASAVVPLAILSLLLINAQALSAITGERDLKSIDLLLVTDVTPPEFVFGKLLGIFFNAKEMIAAPLIVLGVAWGMGLIGWAGVLFSALIFLVLALFASVLGLHAGLRHPTTRRSIANSLGTMFLLFVGVLTCLYLIVISGRFEAQWASFVLFIVLGSIGLWISLSANAPSSALTLTSTVAPVATFYTILAFAVGDRFAPFLVLVGTYGFAVMAMLVPMLAEFDVATGRTSAEGD
jgi:ABC-type transport system involved in multi-copper enzyme maturation permease subunit